MAKAPSLITALRPWLGVLAGRRRRLWLGGGLMALTLLSALGLFAVSGWFITATGLTGLLLAAGAAATLDVYVPGGAIRLFAVTRTASRYLERLYNHDTVLRLLADLRTRLFTALAGQDSRVLAGRRASDWLNRLTADIDTLDSLYLRLLAPPAVALLAGALLSAGAAFFVPQAGAVLAAVLLAGWLWLTLGQARLGMSASRRHVDELEALRGGVIDTLQGLAELEAYATLAHRRRRLETLEARLHASQRRLGRRVALGNAVQVWLVGSATLATLWLAARAFQAGGISGAVMVMLPMAVLAMNEAFGALPAAFTWLGATRGAAERLNELNATPTTTPPAAAPPPENALTLTLERVGVHYPDALQPALSALSFTLAPGERLAVEGASGSGKSTLTALLGRQLAPSEGRITLGGVALDAWPDAALRRRVAVLTQQSELLDDSLAANLRLASPDADDAALWRALDQVALADWADALPQGLNTRVGEGGRRISGGQARRVALARIVLRDPALVVLDEPFAGIDRATAQALSAALDRWLAGRSVVYLVHEADDAALAGIARRVTLVEGRPAAATIHHGTPPAAR
ncbi:thiol reductant ABC exporter subunit CydC [Halomonas cibimaris]|uniref:Thiol reductant ABC exporter subunit CydC n=1 Tax=Halomonas cibimaris TaxID=657012 RepID=A0ABP7LBU1_9GAMM